MNCHRGSPAGHRLYCFALLFLPLLLLGVRPALRADDGAVVTGPEKLYAGGKSAVTVNTFAAETRQPITRDVTLTLTSTDGSTRLRLPRESTGDDGHLRVEFDVPTLPSGSYKILAAVDGLDEVLELPTTISREPGILIETDKPIYKPAQTIQGRVILLDNGLRPVSGDVEVTFHDAKGIRIDRRQLESNEYGVAAFSLDLAKEVNFGTWKIRARSAGAENARDLMVEEYTLPRFDLKTELPRNWALVSEPVNGKVTARYFFGRDVEGSAVVSARRWVGVWEEYATAEGSLVDGEFEFTLPPVEFVSGTPGASGQGSVTLEVAVTDSTGHTQDMTEVLTITEAPVVLSLVARTRALKPGMPADVLVSAKSPDGAAMDIEVDTTAIFYSTFGEQLGESREVIATRDGLGILTVTPPADTSYAEIHARAEVSGHGTSTILRLGGAYSPSGSFLSLTRLEGDEAVSVGEQVSFSAVSTHPGTVYYEVYAGGRTVVSDAVEADTFSVTVSPEMLPRAKVVAYKINPDNEVAADSVAFDVLLSVSASVSAGFDEEEVKPGDPVEVTLDAGTGRPTLLGVSVVDESVLALGRSRLHMADVFAELERRFLEPQVEVHEGNGGPEPGGGPMPGDFLFEMPRTRGALDILNEAGLAIVASRSVSIPEGAEIDFWRWAEDAAGPPVPGAGGEPPPDDAIRVRQYFPETWVWEPLLMTDENGLATLSLEAPDSITGWKLSVVGTCPGDLPAGSNIGFGEAELTVFQEFFVEPSLPYSVVRGEEFPVKVDLFNYLEAEQTVDLEFAEAEGFEITGDSELSVTVPPGSATSVHFPIRPTEIGEFPVRITARGSTLSDAVLRNITVIPEGNPVEDVVNGVIEPDTNVPLDVSFPPVAVPGSSRAYLHITPSPVAQTMNGVSDLLGMPYGCGEQNMIFLAPDIEILKYLRETGELSPEIRATAEYYVNVGYQRQLTFMSDDGGFAAFGGAEGSLWLTAFVLSTFSGAREVRDIDEAVLSGAAAMLLSRQNDDGSFRTDDFLIHQEMDGGMENIYTMAAYVTNALADYVRLAPPGTEPDPAVLEGMEKAAAYLDPNLTTLPGADIWNDPYSLAIAAVALPKVAGHEAGAEAILDRLLELAVSEGIGIHWEPYPVETTGYAAMALLESNGGAGRPEASAAIEWLSAQRNALGGYGQSTQDTVVAIRALFLAARKVHTDLDVTLRLLADGEALETIHVDESNYDLFLQLELPLSSSTSPDQTPQLELVSEGSGSVGYQVVKRYNVPGDILPPSRDMILDVLYDSSHIEVDDIVDVRVSLQYTGPKEETGMVIADIGVPTGFSPVRTSLDSLVEDETVSRVEVAGRKVIFYIDSLESGVPLTFAFQVLALYPVRAEGTTAHAYEYYDASVEAFDGQGSVTISERTTAPGIFVRGDSNEDGEVNLTDAVSTLDHLFRGGPRPPCMDAADSDDDGVVNITDPIFLLQFLFLGGAEPAPPFPEAGPDETEDGLDC